MSKFSDQVAQGMSDILKNESFYKPFNKVTVKVASDESAFNITELELRYPDAYNALTDADKEKFKFYTFYLNSVGKVCAKAPGTTDEFMFFHSPDRPATWMKTAESDESAFELYAAKKKDKKEEDDDKESKKDKKSDKKDKSDKDEKDDKKDKSDKKSKKDDKDDEEEDEKDDKKSKKKKSKKDDEDKNDAMALIFAGKKEKEDKKDGEEKADKEDKPKGKKKQFPFWLKKKKAGENCKEECDCDECMEANDGMFASAIRHIVDTFTKTSAALDNMGLEKSSIATMAILDHIISEAAYIKVAKESPAEEKLKKLKEKFKKMHDKDAHYDADAAEELDKEITKIEDELKKNKKEDSNDVVDYSVVDQIMSEILNKNILNLSPEKYLMGGGDISKLLALEAYEYLNKHLNKSITPSELIRWQQNASRALGKFRERLLSGKNDSNDVRGTDLLLGLDDPEAQEGFSDPNLDDPHSSAALEEILLKNPSLVDEIAPRLKSQFGDRAIEDQLKDRIKSRLPSVIETPKENSDITEILKAHNPQIPSLDKLPGFVKEYDPLETKIDELNADDKFPMVYLNKDHHDKNTYCASCAKKMKKTNKDMYGVRLDHLPATKADKCHTCGKKFKSDSNDIDDDDIVNAFNLVNKWVKEAEESTFEDDSDEKVTQADLKSIFDVISPYSDKEISDREEAMVPSKLDSFADEFLNAVKK